MRWGRTAAGALPVCWTTGRVFLALRSAWVNEPHTWGLPGGKMEYGEAPAQAALREMEEEIGHHDGLVLIPSFIYEEGSFRFYNFLAMVPWEFEPDLNDESDDAGWFSLDDLPSPLHFGADALLAAARPQIVEAIRACRE
jgi:8-oxo-dGTP pyrophosphatase MutT (NUDIX family)